MGNRGRIQESLRSAKMRSHIATVTPGSTARAVSARAVCVSVCGGVRKCERTKKD